MSNLDALRALFYREGGADTTTAILLTSEVSRRYMTGFASSDGFVLISPADALFLTDSRYIEAAQQSVTDMPVCEQDKLYAQLAAFFEKNQIEKVEIEAGRLSCREAAKLQAALERITVLTTGTVDDCLDALRCIKTEEETAQIVAAQRIAEQAFEHILGFIRPGVTEREIALQLDYFMLSHGAEALSFETIAISGENTSKPHGVPGARQVQNGDFVTMDYGAVVGGLHSDMTRTVAVGSVSEEQKRVYQTVLDAKNTVEQMLSAGVRASDGDKAARQVIEDAGYGGFFRHSTGHGVGLEIHEFPNLSPRSDYVLCEGNVVTVEPGIYLPSRFGVRVEDMVLIEKNGCRRLTEAPEALIVL